MTASAPFLHYCLFITISIATVATVTAVDTTPLQSSMYHCVNVIFVAIPTIFTIEIATTRSGILHHTIKHQPQPTTTTTMGTSTAPIVISTTTPTPLPLLPLAFLHLPWPISTLLTITHVGISTTAPIFPYRIGNMQKMRYRLISRPTRLIFKKVVRRVFSNLWSRVI